MKKGVLLTVILLILISAVVLTACMTVPQGGTSSMWTEKEVGTYAVLRVKRDGDGNVVKDANDVTQYDTVGNMVITIEPVKDGTVPFGEEDGGYTGMFFNKLTYDIKYDNDLNGVHEDGEDVIYAESIFSMNSGAPLKEYSLRKITAADGVQETVTLSAEYKDKSYSYTAVRSGKEEKSSIPVGEHKSPKLYYGNMQEYVLMRNMYALNTTGSFSLTYKIPVWIENAAVEVTAALTSNINELDLSATGGETQKMQCYKVDINKTSDFPGKGTARSVYYIRSDKKDGDNWVYTDTYEGDTSGLKYSNLVTVSGGKQARFVLAGFDEGDYSYRLRNYVVGIN